MSLFTPQNDSDVGPETVSFDKNGEVVHLSPLRRFFLALVILLVTGLSFGLGRLTAGSDREPVQILNTGVESKEQRVSIDTKPTINSASAVNSVSNQDATVYASVNGKRYYYMHCKSSVAEKNKVTFATSAQAESAGYTLATNCKAQ
jgi:hypothetical protein